MSTHSFTDYLRLEKCYGPEFQNANSHSQYNSSSCPLVVDNIDADCLPGQDETWKSEPPLWLEEEPSLWDSGIPWVRDAKRIHLGNRETAVIEDNPNSRVTTFTALLDNYPHARSALDPYVCDESWLNLPAGTLPMPPGLYPSASYYKPTEYSTDGPAAEQVVNIIQRPRLETDGKFLHHPVFQASTLVPSHSNASSAEAIRDTSNDSMELPSVPPSPSTQSSGESDDIVSIESPNSPCSPPPSSGVRTLPPASPCSLGKRKLPPTSPSSPKKRKLSPASPSSPTLHPVSPSSPGKRRLPPASPSSTHKSPPASPCLLGKRKLSEYQSSADDEDTAYCTGDAKCVENKNKTPGRSQKQASQELRERLLGWGFVELENGRMLCLCRQSFSRNADAERHWVTRRGKGHECDRCGHRLSRHDALRRHQFVCKVIKKENAQITITDHQMMDAEGSEENARDFLGQPLGTLTAA